MLVIEKAQAVIARPVLCCSLSTLTKRHEYIAFLKFREEKVLFQLFVVIFDKCRDQVDGRPERLSRKAVAAQTSCKLFVNQQQAPQYSMFAHQILDGRDILGLWRCIGGQQRAAGRSADSEGRARQQETLYAG